MKCRPAASFMPIDAAMEHVFEVNSRAELLAYLKGHYDFWCPTDENVTIKFYCRDDRIGWDTHLVCVDGKAALFTDGPLVEPEKPRVFLQTGEELVGADGAPLTGDHPLDGLGPISNEPERDPVAIARRINRALQVTMETDRKLAEARAATVNAAYAAGDLVSGAGGESPFFGRQAAKAFIEATEEAAEEPHETDYEELGYPETEVRYPPSLESCADQVRSWQR
jgi:hypothetical protein